MNNSHELSLGDSLELKALLQDFSPAISRIDARVTAIDATVTGMDATINGMDATVAAVYQEIKGTCALASRRCQY